MNGNHESITSLSCRWIWPRYPVPNKLGTWLIVWFWAVRQILSYRLVYSFHVCHRRSLHCPLWHSRPHLFLLSLLGRHRLLVHINWFGKLSFGMLLRLGGGSHQVITMSPDLEGLHLLTAAEASLFLQKNTETSGQPWWTVCDCFSWSLPFLQKFPFNTQARARQRWLLLIPVLLNSSSGGHWARSQHWSQVHSFPCCLIRLFCFQAYPLSVGFNLLMIHVIQTRH